MAKAIIDREGKQESLEFSTGMLLSELLRMEGHSFELPCGGAGTCLRCRVRAEGALSQPTAEELRVFGEEELRQGWRLACRTRAIGDVRLTGKTVDRLEQIMADGDTPEFSLNPLHKHYGIAVDIGTTTMVARLYDASGPVGTVSVKNPQTLIGADVITRIEKALAGQEAELAASVRGAILELAQALALEKGISLRELEALVLTGNTAMLHLLTGESTEPLSHAPFEVKRLYGEHGSAATLLPELENTALYLPRCISAFVGADITTAILATGMCDRDETAVLMDIGTNGEIALWHKGVLHCTSTAAGPAFEGVGISMGVYGINGAVDKVWMDGGEARFTTIGGAAPVGICGSGIVDAIAVMLKSGVLDETGAFADEEQDEFAVAPGIMLTDRDIRMVQLAKGSVRAGLETLLHTAGVEKEQVSSLYIAGGFGNYLNLSNAAVIGLVPEELLPVAKAVGNAALTGASMILRNHAFAEETEAMADQAESVALDANPVFMDYYMQYMSFGDEEE